MFGRFLLAVLLLIPSLACGNEVKIGTRIDGLSFKDTRYLSRTLDDLPPSKATVLVFTTTSCPLVGRYLPHLSKLEKEYRSKGVQFVNLDCEADSSIRAAAAQAVEHDIEYPVCRDTTGNCARLLGVTKVPQVVVLDAERRLRYRGRIDDRYRPGGARPSATRNDLEEALTDLLAGKEVRVPETPVDGCLITPPTELQEKTPVTFADHIAPILHKHCVECHRPGTAAPFALVTYEDVAGKANTIAEVVRDERMPPWYGAPAHTEFINQRGLSARERQLIQQWAKSGRLRGTEAKLPKPLPPEQNRWKIGTPDLIIKAPQHELPAEGIVEYKYVLLPYLFTHDTWVQGVQILPDNPRVLHHCNMAWLKLGEKFSMNNFITGTVPGGGPMTLDSGVGLKIPAGAMLVLQVHYVTTGKPEKCQISVGFKYASGTIDRHLRFQLVDDHKFAIPPGAPAHRVASSRILPVDALGMGLFCHMHLRGKDMTFRAHYPDGRSETLLIIPNYNFDWQHAYRWELGKKKLPRGTRLEVIARYDNSSFNPFNPDPKATVRDGQQTFHEMMNGFVFYVDENEKLGLHIDGKTGRVKPSAR